MEIKQLLKEMIEDSENYLKKNDTNYNDVLSNKDTTGYSEVSENNNFEAGIISACQDILLKLEVYK